MASEVKHALSSQEREQVRSETRSEGVLLPKSTQLNNTAVTKELSTTVGQLVPGKSVLLYGSPLVYYTTMVVIRELLKKVSIVGVVDAANRYDAYGLAQLAARDGINPMEVLNRVFISRVFTAFQADAVLTRGVEPFLEASNSKVLIVLGLLRTFYDDQISGREAERSLARIEKKFDTLKKKGISILLASENLVPDQKERAGFPIRLKSMSDDVYEVNADSLPHAPSGNVVWNKRMRPLLR